MRDVLLYLHILAGLAMIVFPLIIIINSKKKSSLVKPLAVLTAIIGWLMLIPAGKLYLTFYPATKTLIKAGGWPWAHLIVMEVKEHWGILVPIIATIAAFYVYDGKVKESNRWWVLLLIIIGIMFIMGELITTGGLK